MGVDCILVTFGHQGKEITETSGAVTVDSLKDALNDFMAYSINKEDTVEYIKKCYEDNKYLIDPHTAVAYGSYLNLKEELKGKTCIVSTASPYKFLETVNKVFKIEKEGIDLVEETSKIVNMEIPDILYDIYNKKVEKEVWEKENMEKELLKLIGEIDENC